MTGGPAADVVVIGAGIVGAATARELAVRGVAVTLVDRGEVSGGTTGLGEGNVLASDKDAGPELALTLAGLGVYDEIDARLGAEAQVRRKGALIVHPDHATWAAEPERVERLRAAGVEAELLDPEAVREREPALTGRLHGASFFARDLQCAPRAITRALAREAAAAGARVWTGCEVEAIDVRGGRAAGVRLRGGERAAAGARQACGFAAASGRRRARWSSPRARGARRSPPARGWRCRSSRGGASCCACRPGAPTRA